MAEIVVTGGQAVAVLAVVRSLSRQGHRVTALGETAVGPALLSRCVDRRIVVEPERVGDVVQELFAGGRYDAVIPGTDPDLLGVARRFDGTVPPPGVPSLAAATAVLDRQAIAEAALAADVDWPSLIPCTSADEVVSACRKVGYPAMVKPVHVVVSDGRRAVRHAAVRVADDAAARAAMAAIGVPVHVQRVIHGSVGSLGGLMIGGELVAYAAAKYVRIWPPAAGNASAAVTIEAPPSLTAAAAAIVGGLGYEGIFQLEFITQGDGRIAPIDLNPRPYGSMGLAIAAGADLPALWVDWLARGRRPANPATGRPGVRFCFEETEIRNAAAALRAGRLGASASILRPRRRTAYAFSAVGDPGPAAGRLVLAGQAAVRRAWQAGRGSA